MSAPVTGKSFRRLTAVLEKPALSSTAATRSYLCEEYNDIEWEKDLGHENRTPWSQEKLYQLLSYCAGHQLALMVTTSYEIARLDGRIAGQIRHNPDCEILNL